MNHQANKQYNTKKEGVELVFLQYCMEHEMRCVLEFCHNNLIRLIPASPKKAIPLYHQ